MPIGIRRLNAQRSHPNDRIVFIKPLPGPSESVALDFLERIAAQCYPIMKEHTTSVMSLEEYEPNPEFVGRNFNAGEVIQLVLKSRSGRWLPFEYVQMVMMHELAHCKQMNHSRAFWAVRNQYAEQMRGLWSKGYTGEGLWGRGTLLETGEFQRNTVQPTEPLPEHLCGGTFRSRGRKRKAKPKLSYQEQKERRILKKFGANGVALGADDETKVKLEKGKKTQAKPRVAGSARGRELRAAAALARFEVTQKEDDVQEVKEESDESDYEEDPADVTSKDAVDLDGKKLLDGKGRGLIKVCEDENPDDEDAQQELRELQGVNQWRRSSANTAPERNGAKKGQSRLLQQNSSDTQRAPREPSPQSPRVKAEDESEQTAAILGNIHSQKPEPSRNDGRLEPPPLTVPPEEEPQACPICSFANPPESLTCAVCSNVLDPDSMPSSWRCQGSACKESVYLNPGDYGVCGVCGKSRQKTGSES